MRQVHARKFLQIVRENTKADLGFTLTAKEEIYSLIRKAIAQRREKPPPEGHELLIDLVVKVRGHVSAFVCVCGCVCVCVCVRVWCGGGKIFYELSRAGNRQ